MIILRRVKVSHAVSSTTDRLELMRLFVRIAELDSLSAAARNLGISQPSASRRLKDLEAILGAQLALRTTHDLSLTDAGEQFLAEARSILENWERAVDGSKSARGDISGPLRIAAPTGLGQTMLPAFAARFLAMHPAVTIEWLLNDEPRDLVSEGIDLWLRVGPVADTSLIVKELWKAERWIVASPDSARTIRDAKHPRELAGQPAVVPTPFVDHDIAVTSKTGETHQLSLNARFATDNIFAALNVTKAGVGYSILAVSIVSDDLASGALVRICPRWSAAPLTFSIAYSQSRYRPRRVTEFIDFLRSNCLTSLASR